MSILAWVVLGLIAGFTTTKLVRRNGGGLVTDSARGIVGAIIGSMTVLGIDQMLTPPKLAQIRK